MNFLAPEMLLGLLLIPVAIGFYLWAQRRRSRYAVRFTNLALLSNLVPRRPSWRRHLPPALYLGAIAALLIGLARPTMVVAVPREDATVILAMDVSGSMRATDVSPTRLDAARASALSFIDQLPENVRVGIVSFASEPVTLVSPTTDRAQLKSAIDGLTARDGTAMGDALMQVLDIAEKIQQAGTETPDATAAPRPAAPGSSGAPTRGLGPPTGASARRPTCRRDSRWWPRSCSRTARTRSGRRSRSMLPRGRRRSASRSTPSHSARPRAPSTSRTSSARWSRSMSRRTPRRSTRSRRSPAGRRSTRRPRRTCQRLRQPPVTDRLHGGAPGGHLRPGRRGPAPRRPRGGDVRGLVRPAAVGSREGGPRSYRPRICS